MLLRADGRSPLAPSQDEGDSKEDPLGVPIPPALPNLFDVEHTKGEGADGKEGKKPGEKGEDTDELPAPGTVPEVKIDFEEIARRVVRLAVPARDYTWLLPSDAGALLLLERPPADDGRRDELTLHRVDVRTGSLTKLLDGVSWLNADRAGRAIAFQKRKKWYMMPTPSWGIFDPGGTGFDDKALDLDDLEVRVDPRAEWRQMYREVWRLERDFFYDPKHHGLDLKEAEARFAPFVDGVGSRAGLNDLFGEMLGELSASHVYVEKGDLSRPRGRAIGLLGADLRVEEGRYRFARIFQGDPLDTDLKAPLAVPGAAVREGEYLLAIDGREVRPPADVDEALEGLAYKPVVLRVGPTPDGEKARVVTVETIGYDRPLRRRAWVEANRRMVDRLGGGRLAYVHLPDTGRDGLAAFKRHYYAQVGKEGLLVDGRYNEGGKQPLSVVEAIVRPLMSLRAVRDGIDHPLPIDVIFGPRALLINQGMVSGGDQLAWFFRRAQAGPLVGTRTVGAATSYSSTPELIDGGLVSAPLSAFYSPEGTWEIEGVGVAPDVEVECDPHAVREGRDPQLEKAVAVVLDALKTAPARPPRRPEPPDRHRD